MMSIIDQIMETAEFDLEHLPWREDLTVKYRTRCTVYPYLIGHEDVAEILMVYGKGQKQAAAEAKRILQCIVSNMSA